MTIGAQISVEISRRYDPVLPVAAAQSIVSVNATQSLVTTDAPHPFSAGSIVYFAWTNAPAVGFASLHDRCCRVLEVISPTQFRMAFNNNAAGIYSPGSLRVHLAGQQFSRVNSIQRAENAIFTAIDHVFVPGDAFWVATPNGMREIEDMAGQVLAASQDTIVTNLDTSVFSTYGNGAVLFRVPGWFSAKTITEIDAPEPPADFLRLTNVSDAVETAVRSNIQRPLFIYSGLFEPGDPFLSAVSRASRYREPAVLRETYGDGSRFYYRADLIGGLGRQVVADAAVRSEFTARVKSRQSVLTV